MTLPAFRPRSATEIVDAAIQLGRRHYVPLVTLGAIVSIPSLIIALVTTWLMPPQAAVAPSGGDFALVMLMTVVSMCWLFVGFGALVGSASAAYVEGRALEPMDALRRALRRAGTLIGVHLVAVLIVSAIVMAGVFGLMVVAGIIAAFAGALSGTLDQTDAAAVGLVVGGGLVVLMLVGSLLVYSRFVNVTALVMLEGLGIGGALKRSVSLVQGSLRRTIGVVAIMWVLYLVIYLSLWALTALVIRSFELSGNVASVLVVMVYPFMACLLVLLYYDLRIRREGYDLELMAQALEGASPSDPSPSGASPSGASPSGASPSGASPSEAPV